MVFADASHEDAGTIIPVEAPETVIDAVREIVTTVGPAGRGCFGQAADRRTPNSAGCTPAESVQETGPSVKTLAVPLARPVLERVVTSCGLQRGGRTSSR